MNRLDSMSTRIAVRRSLDALQKEMHYWRQRNFPTESSEDQFLGVVEEVGELAHAILKHKQAIRSIDDEKFTALERDSIGDILIYLAGYCSVRGISMAEALLETWAEVEQRDWIANPTDGQPQ